MRNATIGFITCSELGGMTADDAILAAELRTRGFDVVSVYWDREDPPANASLVVRSPWDYHLKPAAFLEWIDRGSQLSVVQNTPSLIRWNVNKRYLLELESAGIPIVPTAFCRRGASYDLPQLLSERGWKRAVVKPAISASSFMTAIVGDAGAFNDGDHRSRFAPDGQKHLDEILSTRDALVQPLIEGVFSTGERSLICIDGKYSHAVQKGAFVSAVVGVEAVEPAFDERMLAQRVLELLPETPLYARVDVVRGSRGTCLMELELIDPELYARSFKPAAGLFANALSARLFK